MGDKTPIQLWLVTPDSSLQASLERQLRGWNESYRLHRADTPAEAIAQCDGDDRNLFLLADGSNSPEKFAAHRLDQWSYLSRMSCVSRVVSSMSHEMNQPLATIANFAQACRHRLLHNESLDREALSGSADKIASQAHRMGKIIRRLRHLVRPSNGDLPTTDVRIPIAEAVEILSAEARIKKIELAVDFPSEVPPAKFDRRQIEQAVMNLIQNSIDALRETETARKIVVRVESANENLSIDVIDNGVGVHEEDISRIFELFHTTKKHGTGLGLAVGRWIATVHGGTLEAKRNSGPGMTFRLSLPCTNQGVAT
jgi:signal transduction histidine kinase